MSPEAVARRILKGIHDGPRIHLPTETGTGNRSGGAACWLPGQMWGADREVHPAVVTNTVDKWPAERDELQGFLPIPSFCPASV